MVNEREPEVTTDEVRGGSTPGVVRYVLAISVALLVVLFAGLLIYYR